MNTMFEASLCCALLFATFFILLKDKIVMIKAVTNMDETFITLIAIGQLVHHITGGRKQDDGK